MGIHLKYTFDNIDDFYNECAVCTPGIKMDEYKDHVKEDDPYFRGLPLNEILDSKYCYTKGLENLKEIEMDVNIAGKKTKYRYDENDGDDMNMERYNEAMSCMRKRVPTHGNQTGKFVNLYISISENCNVGPKQMLNRVYLSVQVADFLESNGYRVGIYVYDRTRNPGRLPSGETVDTMDIVVTLKNHEDPLNKGLLVTGISPWFFRYWVFMFMRAKLITAWGLGQASDFEKPNTKEELYIRSGECLSPDGCKRKLEEFKNFFEKDEEEGED